MAEKGVTGEIIDSDVDNLSNELLEVSPYSELPVLVDRDVCLYDSVILMEYLDERFPHPPLLPVYPVSRAEIRLFIQRVQKDWCNKFDNLIDGKLTDSESKKVKQEFKSQILGLSPILKEKPFFMSEDFSLVDCCIAPILWRLPIIGIELQKDTKTKPIYEYMQRVFTRPCFIESLSELERDMRS
jgi:RNA polymerase-associated protein